MSEHKLVNIIVNQLNFLNSKIEIQSACLS